MSREMKDSGVEWIGKIPNNWKLVPHKYIFKYVKGKKVDTKDTKEKDYLPYITMGVQRGTDEPLWGDKKQGIKVKKNDICILWDGANAGEFYKSISDGLLSSTSAALKVLAEKNSKEIIRYPKVYNQYLYYYLKVYETDLKNHTIGMGIPHVNGGKLRNDNMVIPGIEEQFKIANFLDEKTSEIDNIVEKTKQSIEELKAYKQSLITETVTKGLDPDIEKKDSKIINVSSIPIHWNTAKLGNIAKLQTGTTPSTKNEILFNGEYNWYTPSDLDDFILKGSSRKLNRLAIDDKIVPKYPKNSVLVVGIGATIGKVAYSDHECSSNQQITAVIPNSQLEGKYLAYYMLVNTSLIRNTAQYTTLPIINNNDLSKIFIIIPPLKEQKEIVDYLDEKTKLIDNLINKKQQTIKELESYKQSLIYEYVTGKKEVE